MVRQCKEHGLPEPEFISVRNREFRTILPRDIYTDAYFQQAGLNERQIEAVKFVKVKGRITNKEYQAKFNLKKRQSTDDLKEIESNGIFTRIGTTGKGTYYILKGAPKGHFIGQKRVF